MELEKVVKKIYTYQVNNIKEKNIKLEREYFTSKGDNIPFKEIMENKSFLEHFANFKQMVEYALEKDLDEIFMLLEEYFLFSAGHDMMFRKKLEADIFLSEPMNDFLYPKLYKAVKEKFNDVSVMRENPNYNKNMITIDRMVFTYIEMNSLLYLLYCCDFKFPEGYERLFPSTHEDILKILTDLKITIGDFLNGLIDYKCMIMKDIFKNISDLNLRKIYLEKVEILRRKKLEVTKTFAHVNLPITYFLNHTEYDFIMMKNDSGILEDNSYEPKRVILP